MGCSRGAQHVSHEHGSGAESLVLEQPVNLDSESEKEILDWKVERGEPRKEQREGLR